MRIKKLLATAALAAMTFSLVACGGSNDKSADTSSSDKGTITITGSTSVEPIVNAMKTEYVRNRTVCNDLNSNHTSDTPKIMK